MNFTREPLIETIITPKEGYKLLVRSSKTTGQEEYQVDAVEVVSFGRSFFFRSQEKPKSFLVPVSDYEVVEVKEARLTLKNANIERAIKIGGGKEQRAPKEAPEEAPEESASEEEQSPQPRERRRDRRHRRRRRDGRQEADTPEQKDEASPVMTEEGGGAQDETQVSSSTFSALFPPPTTLISETIGRYKEKDFSLPERDLSADKVEEEENTNGEESSLSRVSVSYSQETTSFGLPFDRT